MPAGVRFPGLAQWLDWQQSLHPQLIDLGLERAARVLARTGWRRPGCPVITVGGTNGKGSCVALLASMLRAGGYRTCSFTSPHLVDYRERIRVNGDPVSEVSLIAAFERIADALGQDSLTFFEFNTLAALLVFETAVPDAIVLEVGMGGRLDAVNLVDADVAIVVSVGLDHMEWLGADVESIGREKAGILRCGRPALVGTHAVPQSIVDCARETGADLRLIGRDFDGQENPGGTWNYRDESGELPRLPAPGLDGTVQIGNAATALAALRALDTRLPLPRPAIERGLRDARLSGRFQRIAAAKGFEWVLDVAHNPDSARVLAGNLARFGVTGRTIAVCGMLADKDVESVVEILRNRVDAWIACGTVGPRALDDASLSARAAARGIAMQPGGSVPQALARAAAMAGSGDRVVVFGSFHTVGPALEYLCAAQASGGGSALCV
jgi:dihydrofolate synthase / folylpolyglutamate synthase